MQHYRPAERNTDGFFVARPTDGGHQRLELQLHGNYALDPLVYSVRMPSGEETRYSAIRHHAALDLVAAYSLFDRLVLFGGLPANVVMRGEELPGEGSVRASGMGDPWVGARLRLLGQQDAPFVLGVRTTATVPLAEWQDSSQRFEGDAKSTFHGQVLGEVRLGTHRFNANAGARVRSGSELYGTSINDEFTYALGYSVPFGRSVLGHVEAWGATPFANLGSRESSPLEVLLGGKYSPCGGLKGVSSDSSFYVGGAVSVGALDGYGTPVARGVLSFGIGPERPECSQAAAASPPPAPADRDGDGVPDASDACVDQAETFNGFEDGDGCPDVLPEPDRDGDGIVDSADRCPDEKGVAEHQGCAPPPPAVAPSCPEGQKLDAQGTCVAARVVVGTDALQILEKINFETGSANLVEGSHQVLDEVVAVLKRHPEIDKVQVEGHTDNVGLAATNLTLSQRRAEAVVAYLVSQGIDAGRLVAKGFGDSNPLGPNTTVQGRALNRRVEFRFVQDGAKDL